MTQSESRMNLVAAGVRPRRPGHPVLSRRHRAPVVRACLLPLCAACSSGYSIGDDLARSSAPTGVLGASGESAAAPVRWDGQLAPTLPPPSVTLPATWGMLLTRDIVAVGDLDGDGYGDLASIEDTENGYVIHLRYGRNTAQDERDAAAFEVDGAYLVDETPGPFLSELLGLWALGDLNGDGYADFGFAQVPLESPTETTGLDIVYGGAQRLSGAVGLAVAATHLSPPTSAASTPCDFWRSVPKALGDIDGDGLDDLAIMDCGQSPDLARGQGPVAHVFYGRAEGRLSGSWSAADAVWSSFDGTGLAPAGDVDGDGLADLFFSAIDASSPSTRSRSFLPGRAERRLGKVDLSQAATPIDLWVQPSPLADFDGDGINDLLVRQADSDSRCEVLYGRPGLFSGGSEVPDAFIEAPPADYVLFNPVGDLDGDGDSELVVSPEPPADSVLQWHALISGTSARWSGPVPLPIEEVRAAQPHGLFPETYRSAAEMLVEAQADPGWPDSYAPAREDGSFGEPFVGDSARILQYIDDAGDLNGDGARDLLGFSGFGLPTQGAFGFGDPLGHVLYGTPGAPPGLLR